MEKSIEHIWKEGFLKKDALVAPKINNLYTQKSIHIIDKFKRMFSINLIAIVAFSFTFLVVSFFIGIPVTGVILCITLSVLVVINKKLLNDLESIDKSDSSYEYLKTFNQWIKKQVAINKRISTFLYPIIFVSILLGFWFEKTEGIPLKERIVRQIIVVFPDTYLIYGVPLIFIIIAFLILGLLAFFGGKIYLWDVNIVYGRIFKKLEELMADIESLRS